MTIVRTDLRDTRERASEIRFEPTGRFSAINVQKAIEQIAVPIPTAITVASSPYTPLSTDTLLYLDTSGGPITINLASGASRLGAPLTIKDVTGNASTNNVTVKPIAGENIDATYTNGAPLVLNADFAGIRINPRTGSYTVDP